MAMVILFSIYPKENARHMGGLLWVLWPFLNVKQRPKLFMHACHSFIIQVLFIMESKFLGKEKDSPIDELPLSSIQYYGMHLTTSQFKLIDAYE